MRDMDPWKMCESNEGDPKVGKRFVCGRCKKQVNGLVEPVEECERFLLFGG